MRKVLISYANGRYKRSQDILEQTALDIGGVNKVISYTEDWLKTTEFWKKNSFILNRPRGAGYWIWKPYIIMETFKELSDGDAVMYSDAGISVIGNLNPLFEIAQSGTNGGGKLIYDLQYKNKMWTKRDCFVVMNCDEEKYWNGKHASGSTSVWIKNDKNIEFLNEWQRYLRDPRVVTDDPNMCGRPNLLEFKDHRHDQSILSLLTIKYGYELYRDPTQFGNGQEDKFPNSPYLQLLNHHRGNI